MKSLPTDVEELLAKQNISPRLRAHLTLVHDVAFALTEAIRAAWPGIDYDAQAVLFGAATHDIGKIRHPEELSGPGHAHEEAGVELMLACGVSVDQARFARTHAQWQEAGIYLEDLLVALADKIWRGRRHEALEQAVVQEITAQTGEEAWRVWLQIDDLLSDLAATADERLMWQAKYPV